MNRAARRRKQKELEKVKKPPTYNLSQAQLKAIVDKEVQERLEEVKHLAINETIKGLTAAFIISLSDEFGFGIKRMSRLLDKVQNQFECIEAGTVELEDLIEWVLEFGIDIKA